MTEARALFAGQDITRQYTAGQWREGLSTKTLAVTNAYDNSVLATIRQASVADVDDA